MGVIDFNLIPSTSGIYFFWDMDGNCLYIGRASNLRQRISQHSATFEKLSELLRAINNLKDMNDDDIWSIHWKLLNTWVKQPIDAVFGDVKNITFLHVPKGNLKEEEERWIREKKPIFNWDTCQRRYYHEQDKIIDSLKLLDSEVYRRIYHKEP